jgi:hypothetical protein
LRNEATSGVSLIEPEFNQHVRTDHHTRRPARLAFLPTTRHRLGGNPSMTAGGRLRNEATSGVSLIEPEFNQHVRTNPNTRHAPGKVGIPPRDKLSAGNQSRTMTDGRLRNEPTLGISLMELEVIQHVRTNRDNRLLAILMNPRILQSLCLCGDPSGVFPVADLRF